MADYGSKGHAFSEFIELYIIISSFALLLLYSFNMTKPTKCSVDCDTLLFLFNRLTAKVIHLMSQGQKKNVA